MVVYMYLEKMQRCNNGISTLVLIKRNNLIHCMPEKFLFMF